MIKISSLSDGQCALASRRWFQYVAATARDAPEPVLRFAYRKALEAAVDAFDQRSAEAVSTMSFEVLEVTAVGCRLASFEQFCREVRDKGATTGALLGGGRPHPRNPLAWAGAAPSACDLCRSTLADEFYDARARDAATGFLCPDCFVAFGIGLGAGRGQWYRRLAGDTFTLLAGGMEEDDVAGEPAAGRGHDDRAMW